MTYIDGFVIPSPTSNVAAYKKMATWGKKLWMKHGALQYFECVADDLSVMPGCGDFKKMAKLKEGETLWFSFIVYKSKAHRNAVNKKVMAEMAQQKTPMPMPFDMKRMGVDRSSKQAIPELEIRWVWRPRCPQRERSSDSARSVSPGAR